MENLHLTKYYITLNRLVSRIEYTTFVISAENEEAARERAEQLCDEVEDSVHKLFLIDGNTEEMEPFMVRDVSLDKPSKLGDTISFALTLDNLRELSSLPLTENLKTLVAGAKRTLEC